MLGALQSPWVECSSRMLLTTSAASVTTALVSSSKFPSTVFKARPLSATVSSCHLVPPPSAAAAPHGPSPTASTTIPHPRRCYQDIQRPHLLRRHPVRIWLAGLRPFSLQQVMARIDDPHRMHLTFPFGGFQQRGRGSTCRRCCLTY